METDASQSPAGVSAMIFTLNEEIHLPGCLQSLSWCDDVIVVDSGSTDRTTAITSDSGARLFVHPFTGFGDQRNWALDNTSPKHPWILILDADERVPPPLAEELKRVSHTTPASIDAYRVKRRFHMWGRWLQHSSLYPTWVVRLVRLGHVRYVNRGHAETQVVDGATADLEFDLIDENLKGIDEWFERQNRYSTKDAEHEIAAERASPSWSGLVNGDPLVRRAALKGIAMRMPGRPLLYFIYAYVLRGGFRDGRDGFVFCMMRALYQGMVVAKKHDIRRRAVAGG
ncbi:glycosyltransferase family 2 protein [Usitatibacter rugosus]|nr:glycosyltransferase family 2 protein [Usitatibacter rugosus]